jgi:hypothetical protein
MRYLILQRIDFIKKVANCLSAEDNENSSV